MYYVNFSYHRRHPAFHHWHGEKEINSRLCLIIRTIFRIFFPESLASFGIYLDEKEKEAEAMVSFSCLER